MGKRVLVVGAGPSGLSAAYHLTRLGHCAAAAPGRVTAWAATTATASARTTPLSSSAPGEYQYEIAYDYCKGCGLCAAECPCGTIEMEPEPS
jgi:glycine/D-amino acid oxidase-like deaminating enzyme